MEISVKKLNAIPSINRKDKENFIEEGSVEERLLRKGKEYK